jgi:hypothetical protein
LIYVNWFCIVVLVLIPRKVANSPGDIVYGVDVPFCILKPNEFKSKLELAYPVKTTKYIQQ